ncbi:hypothetical protein F4604DRAFT_1735425 [Suillus subluteus]|nr:hypothetical protein F4604DRAFT_1735425 [Suillus subluteus]
MTVLTFATLSPLIYTCDEVVLDFSPQLDNCEARKACTLQCGLVIPVDNGEKFRMHAARIFSMLRSRLTQVEAWIVRTTL